MNDFPVLTAAGAPGRTAAAVAEKMWEHGIATGRAVPRRPLGHAGSRGARRDLIAMTVLDNLERESGRRGTPLPRAHPDVQAAAAAFSEACVMAGDREENAASPWTQYLPGIPVRTASGRSGILTGAASLSGCPRACWDDGTESAICRPAILGTVVHLTGLVPGPAGPVNPADGDVILDPAAREASVAAGGYLVSCPPGLVPAPGFPHRESCRTALALLAALSEGVPVEDLAAAALPRQPCPAPPAAARHARRQPARRGARP